MDEEIRICTICEEEIEGDDYYYVGNDIVCSDCFDDECGYCDHCETAIYNNDAVTDDDHFLCESCYENHYTRCEDCGRIIRNEDSYYADNYDLCYDCNEKHTKFIHEYGYKPVPIMYGQGKRHFGVELEIDHAGRDEENAETLLNIANRHDEHLYIKSDGSLDDGMELVTHPMTLGYHLDEFNWDEICDAAVKMGYRSHQTSTCGLHIHVSRGGLGDTDNEQENSFESLRYMAEEVCGNFVFTLLDASNSLWFVKGDNPLYLIHFPDLGLYIYTSTPDIMTTALQRSALHWMRYEVIDAEEGDIIRITPDGKIERSHFRPTLAFNPRHRWSMCSLCWDDQEEEDDNLALLIDMCGYFGMTEDEILELRDMGYSYDEIEEFMLNPSAFQETLMFEEI